ncbi:hypothetical protein ACFW5K_19800 [Streptomyces albidoflavus]
MTASGPLAETRYDQVQGIARSVLEAVQAIWADVTPDRILAAMAGEAGRAILQAVVAGQLSVAAGAQAFVSGAMLAQGVGFGAAGTLQPGALAGIAADGRPLATLLYMPAITTAQGLAAGLDPAVAAVRGLSQMSMLVSTTIADTARTATSVAMTAEPRCVSYVRVVRAPACSRCIILAGRQYAHSEGFDRHPRCDCGMEPMSDAEWRASKGPEDILRDMTPEQREAALGKAGVKALEAGADLGQVVNARRGMEVLRGKKVTSEGTAKRGIGGKALESEYIKIPGRRYSRTAERRLMPEQIFKQARGDRELEIALMRRHGYIT